MKQIAIIGLGRFGISVARHLYESGMEVLVADREETLVEEAQSYSTAAFILDSTDERSLKEMDLQDMDAVVVAIGSDIQASILTTVILKEMGISTVIAKALNRTHGKVLEKVGADRIIYPEKEMGERVAQSIISPNVLDTLQLEKDYSVVEITAPSMFVNKSLQETDIRATYNINIIAINGTDGMRVMPMPHTIIQPHDILVALGHNTDLKKFKDLL